MAQWQSDPIQGMNVYNLKSTPSSAAPKPMPSPLINASKTLSRSYRQILESFKTKEPTGNGYLKPQDASDLLRRFK
jgi:hypothetical protein